MKRMNDQQRRAYDQVFRESFRRLCGQEYGSPASTHLAQYPDALAAVFEDADRRWAEFYEGRI